MGVTWVEDHQVIARGLASDGSTAAQHAPYEMHSRIVQVQAYDARTLIVMTKTRLVLWQLRSPE
jgi:hypothetical protein